MLKGTGTNKAFEAEVYDNYIKEDVREKTDYEYCTEEMWEFINSRYGSDTAIKRFYQKSKYSYYSEIELRFKFVPVILGSSKKLLAGEYSEENF